MNALSLSVGALATAVSQPLDFLKIKTFLINEGIGITGKGYNMGYNPFKIFDNFFNRGYGTRSLYTGFSNAMLGRLSFLVGRNNTYRMFYDYFKPNKAVNDLTYKEKALLSGVSSIVGSVLSNPFMIKYVREVGDLGRKAKYHRLAESVRWNKGFLPYATRMFLLNTFLIGPYNSINEKLYVIFGDVFINRVISVFVASGLGALIATPFDSIRTRLMYQSTRPEINRLQYRGLYDTWMRIVINEGFFSLFAGVKVAWAQMVVYTLSTIYLCDILIEGAKSR